MSLFGIISAVVFPDPNLFLYIPAFAAAAAAAAAAAVNPEGVNTFLANGVITFFIRVNPVFINGPSNLPQNSPDCIIFDN